MMNKNIQKKNCILLTCFELHASENALTLFWKWSHAATAESDGAAASCNVITASLYT